MINNHASYPPEKSNKRYARTARLPQLIPISKGLVMVGVKDPFLIPHVRQALEHAILENSDDLDLQLEGSSLLSLHSGSSNRQARALHDASGPLKKERVHNFKGVGIHSEYRWLSSEGLYTLQAILDGSDEDWITLEDKAAHQITPASAQILVHVREEAEQANAGIIVFLNCSEDCEATELLNFCDEYIAVAPCEPDPDDFVAFSIDFTSIRHLNFLGLGKQMCSIRVSDGRFSRRYAQFVAPDLETRVMWALRGQRKKFAEIGSLLGVNKSTVLRRLQGLPDPRPGDPPDEDWLKRCLELLPNANTGTCDVDVDEDDDDEIDDLSSGSFEN
jgi:hypothetical protein